MVNLYLFSFIIGVILGSFYNVVGLRIPKNESIIRPPSHCPRCQQRLMFIDLIPVLSFIFLKGCCHYCGRKISPIYPIIEVLTGGLFLYTAIVTGCSSQLILGWAIISLLLTITISDLHYMLIPDKVLIFFAIVFLILRIWQPLHPWWSSLVGFAVGLGLLYLIALFSHGGMGGGDIKLFALIGFYFGWQLLLIAFFLSTLYGSIIGGFGLAFGYVKRRKPLPFGPFIALGSLTAYFFGERLLHWYFLIQSSLFR